MRIGRLSIAVTIMLFSIISQLNTIEFVHDIPDSGREANIRNTPGSITIWGTASYGLDDAPEGDDFIAIATGDYHALALRADGTIAAWGAGTIDTGIFPHFGQSITPAGNDYVAIAAGSLHSLALRSDGTLVSWGRNNYGQTGVPPGNSFVAIASGGLHSLAIQEDGSIVAWGAGTTNTGVYPDFGQSITPAGNNYQQIAAGAAHSLAMKEDGTLIAWGRNNYGQASVPAGDDYISISAQNYHNLALKENGSPAAWGRNSAGQCDLPVGYSFQAISAGREHSVGLNSDGSLKAWGMNTHGQCDVPPGSHYTAVAAGYQHSIALKTLQYGLISPTGGESWQAGTERLIRWHYKGPALSLHLEFSSDNGLNWQDIITLEIYDCTYNWTVPLITSSHCRIRGTFTHEGTEYVMTNDLPFTITEDNVPFITLLHPTSENIRLQAGNSEEISWDSFDVTHIDLAYSIDNGMNWTEIAEDVPAETGSYIWTLPDTPTEQGRIRVQDSSDPLIENTSFNPFTIVKIGFITTMSGLELIGGNHFTLEFYSLFTDRFRISYSSNSGQDWTVVENDWNQTYYNWLIPNLESDEMVVRLTDYYDEEINVITDSFTITSDINLLFPNGGENLLVGTTCSIEWEASDSVNNVLIDYSIDSGNSWLPIRDIPYPAATGSFEWEVPDTQSANCLVRVKNVVNHNSFSSSSSEFTISDRSLIVLQPSGGEVWSPGSEEMLLWESSNVSEVSLHYSYDGGNNWLIIEEGIPANSSPYLWEIPEIGTMNGKIRVSDVDNWMVNGINEGYFTIEYYNYPQNLTAELIDEGVELSWEPPIGSLNRSTRTPEIDFTMTTSKTNSPEVLFRWELIGYNLYRNGDMINQQTITDVTYIDSDVIVGETYSYYVTALYDEGESSPSNIIEITITSVSDAIIEPLVTRLYSNYPNPFNPRTTIGFTLASPGYVSLEIFNNRGQRVKRVIDNYLAAGEHSVIWEGRDHHNREVSSGIYFYRLQTEHLTVTRKMMMLK